MGILASAAMLAAACGGGAATPSPTAGSRPDGDSYNGPGRIQSDGDSYRPFTHFRAEAIHHSDASHRGHRNHRTRGSG